MVMLAIECELASPELAKQNTGGGGGGGGGGERKTGRKKINSRENRGGGVGEVMEPRLAQYQRASAPYWYTC